MFGFFKRRKARKRARKSKKIMYDSVYVLMRETLESILNKEKTDKTLTSGDGFIDYEREVRAIRTEVAVTLNYVRRLEGEQGAKK